MKEINQENLSSKVLITMTKEELLDFWICSSKWKRQCKR